MSFQRLLRESSCFHEYHICHNCPFRGVSYIFTLLLWSTGLLKNKKDKTVFYLILVFFSSGTQLGKANCGYTSSLDALFPIPSPQCPTRESTRLSLADLFAKKGLRTISNRCGSSFEKVIFLSESNHSKCKWNLLYLKDLKVRSETLSLYGENMGGEISLMGTALSSYIY